MAEKDNFEDKQMIFDEVTEHVMKLAMMMAAAMRSEYVTPEHVLYGCLDMPAFVSALHICGGKRDRLRNNLKDYIENEIPRMRGDAEDERPMAERLSDGFATVIERAVALATQEGSHQVRLEHIMWAMSRLNQSYAIYFLEQEVGDVNDLVSTLRLMGNGVEEEEDEEYEDYTGNPEEFVLESAVCLNDSTTRRHPLIGREKELERIERVLLRKDKNHPLLVGDAGVGKTSIIYGLVDRIVRGEVPEGLKNSRIYMLEVGELLAGTQYRGDFEKRVLELMDAFSELDNPIVFIDEIHNLVGAGAMGGSMDASNLLKPYLDAGDIRFIGVTTYEEYKKYFSKSTAFMRRFQKIEVKEPTEEEAVKILEGIRNSYESFHHVKYGRGVMAYAVSLAKNYIAGRYLPDKAIDLMDEAGAYRRMYPLTDQKRQTVGKDVIETVLSEIGNIPKATAAQSEVEQLQGLYDNITAQIFGQEEAVRRIVDAICMSRAGLLAENKPIASFLFVGPTGVGKTEVAKVLAKELGIGFTRFDMSEYAEKHTVSKLIGSPAGYVGYEDGGLLTDAIRRTPHCVLLLDEIEKAHPDIFNVLLQVMDYAVLTDNRGQKADFKNVIIIMTSNAGARMIGRQSIGFGAPTFDDGVMMEEVKRVFTPEFRNRLSAIVTFRHMNERMAEQIADKKMGELEKMLAARNVELRRESDAMEYIRRKGITREYGAREIERVIDSEIKPLFVAEILFGGLRNGGVARLTMKDGKPGVVTEGKKTRGSRAAGDTEEKREKVEARIKGGKRIDPEDLIKKKKE